jgi:hypothetical protein
MVVIVLRLVQVRSSASCGSSLLHTVFHSANTVYYATLSNSACWYCLAVHVLTLSQLLLCLLTICSAGSGAASSSAGSATTATSSAGDTSTTAATPSTTASTTAAAATQDDQNAAADSTADADGSMDEEKPQE